MERLIYEDDIRKVVEKYLNADDSNGSDVAMDILSDVSGLLSEQPDIIHCQDCQYAKENQGELWICAHPDNNAWRITKEFYCGRAERREE